MQRVQQLLQGLDTRQKPSAVVQVFTESASALEDAGVELGTLLGGMTDTIPFIFLGQAFFVASDKRGVPVPPTVLEAVGNFLATYLDGLLVRQAATEKNDLSGRLAQLIHAYARHMQVTEGAARFAIRPLLAALRTLQPRPECLTAVHADFFQVCLTAKCLHAARPLLYEDVLEVDPAATGLRARDFLLYCLHGGTVALTLKDLSRALDLFTAALTCPADGLSAITLACYKRFVLASLMQEGRPPALPRGVAAVVHRQMKPYIAVYNDIAKAFEARDRPALSAVLRAQEAALRTDGNWGLALQCEEALTLRMVRSLTQTFLTLSLEDIARKVGLSGPREAEAAVLRLCEEGKIAASIDLAHGGKVEFRNAGPLEAVTAAALDGRIREAVALIEKVRAYDLAQQMDKSFIVRTLKGGGRSGGLDVE